jgi:cytidylate kinase
VRAKRRYDELLRRGISTSYGAVLADMRERDQRDSSRAAAPMRAAEDALVLDTSEMDAAHALAAARAFVDGKLRALEAGQQQQGA